MKTQIIFFFLLMPWLGISQTVVEIHQGGLGSNPGNLTEFDGKLYFSADDGINGQGIYSITGTGAPVRVGNATAPYEFTVLGNRLYYGDAVTGTGAIYFIETGGGPPTQAATFPVGPSDFSLHNGYVYFQADGIYRMPASGIVVTQVSTERGRGGVPHLSDGNQKNIFVVNDLLFFIEGDAIKYIDTNDLSVGTQIVSGSDNYEYSMCCADFIALNIGNYLLVANQGSNASSIDSELIIVDVTTGTPVLTFEELSPMGWARPSHFINHDGYTFFSAYNSVQNKVLIHYFDPNTATISNSIPGNVEHAINGFASDDNFTKIGNRLFFGNNELIVSGVQPSVLTGACFSYPYFIHTVIEENGDYYYISLGSAFNLFRCNDLTSEQLTCLEGLDNAVGQLVYYSGRFYFTTTDLNYNAQIMHWPQAPSGGFCEDECDNDIQPPVCLDANIAITGDANIGFATITFTDYVSDNCSINFSDGNDITHGAGIFNTENLACNTITEFEAAFYDDANNQVICNYTVNVECSACENTALDFDGVDDYVEFNSPLVGNQNYTIEMWVKSESVSTGECWNNSSDNLDWILAFDDNDLGIVDCDGGYRVVFAPLCPSGNNLCSSLDDRPLDDDEWHHLAISEGDPGGFRVYYDGVKFTNFSWEDYDLGGMIRLGSQFGNQGGNKFKGKIDEFRIWDHIRSEDEILENYNCKINPSTAGLVTYYDFSDGLANGDNSTVSQLNDISGNGNSGTLTNFNGTGTSSNFVMGIEELCNSCGGESVVCPTNQVMDFDGIDDVISLNSVAISTDFTVGCWFKTSQDNGGAEDRFFGFGNSPRLEVGVDFVGDLWFYDELGAQNSFFNVRDDIWHHVAVVGLGPNRNIYFDFELLQEFNSQDPNYGPNLKLGSWSPENLSSTAFWGQLDDFRLYNEAFSSSDICEQFSSLPQQGQNNLQVHIDFEEGMAEGNNQGDGVVSNLGNGPDGVLNSFALNGSSSNYICGDYSIDCTTSVDENFEDDNISLYPNPVKDLLLIDSDGYKISSYGIISTNGKVVSQSKFKDGSFNQINTSEIHSGIYLLQLFGVKGDRKILKFIKI